MSNFFEKLKKGMGIEIPTEEEKVKEVVKEKPKEEKKLKRIKKEGVQKIELKVEKVEKPKEKTEVEKPSQIKPAEEKEEWLEPEGELAVDVYQTDSELIIQSAIAGVKPEELDISLEGDMITIEGERKKPFEEKGDYFVQECYWGKFSRKIILPVEINPDQIEATFKDGILTIRLPKILKEKKRKIVVRS